jgi:hypothetical protein
MKPAAQRGGPTKEIKRGAANVEGQALLINVLIKSIAYPN